MFRVSWLRVFFGLIHAIFRKIRQSYDFLAYLCENFIPMKRTYRVAGHKFAVVMPDNNAAWKEMFPYEPFACEDADDSLFTAELVDVMPDTETVITL